jgi:hypothetical protein
MSPLRVVSVNEDARKVSTFVPAGRGGWSLISSPISDQTARLSARARGRG